MAALADNERDVTGQMHESHVITIGKQLKLQLQWIMVKNETKIKN